LQAVGPLFGVLGFEPAARIERADPAVAATLQSAGATVALLVIPWGDVRDPLWRVAVTQAARRDAAWCLIFNGLHLRIVDAGRLYARRHLGIGIDAAGDEPRP